jgi:hypothetical protein
MSATPPRHDPGHEKKDLADQADPVAALSATNERESRALLGLWSTRIADPASAPPAANLAACSAPTG